jgi:ABC-type amino acid transport substrate-binding protein
MVLSMFRPLPCFRISLGLGSGLASLLVLAICFSGCAVVKEDTGPGLRVGVAANAPPLIAKEGGKYTGVEAEFARALGARLGVPIRFVNMPFDKLLSALDAGKIDIVMSGMTVTALREPLAQFCEAYATTGQTLMVQAKDLWTYSYPAVVFVIETRIGVEKGTLSETLARQKCPRATVTAFSSVKAASDALKAGRVDVVMADAPILWRVAAKVQAAGGDLVVVRRFLTQENLAWAVRRGDTEMLDAANAALRAWSADGTLARILSSAMPVGG